MQAHTQTTFSHLVKPLLRNIEFLEREGEKEIEDQSWLTDTTLATHLALFDDLFNALVLPNQINGLGRTHTCREEELC